MNLKKRSMVGAALALALVAGSVAPALAAGLSGSITLGGSTTVQPLAQLWANNFKKINKGVTITVAGGGSGVGVSGAGSTFTIGMSSGAPGSQSGQAALTNIKVARDALTFVVNPSNKVKVLTLTQLKAIWTGKITDWSQVGGAKGKINVYGRAAGSGTGDYVNKTTFGNPALVSTLKTYDSNGLLKAAVAKDKNSIGYVGMAYATSKVRGIQLNGVVASRTNAKSGKYPLVRFLYFLTKPGTPVPAVATAFINYCLSTAGQAAANALYISLK
jgi:phosphate transport system substrate-binding protein